MPDKSEPITGTLTNWDGNDVEIDGKKYPMCIKAANWMREHAYQHGIAFSLELDSKGIVQRGFPSQVHTPKKADSTVPTSTPTSPGTTGQEMHGTAPQTAPGTGFQKASEIKKSTDVADNSRAVVGSGSSNPVMPILRSASGQITAIDHTKQNIAVKDINGDITLAKWPDKMNQHMAKQKQWWFVTITGEEYEDTLFIQDCTFYQKPANWPASGGNKGGYSGGKSYTPRNEKPMLSMSVFKSLCELHGVLQVGGGFNATADMIWEKSKEIAAEMMKESGA